MRTCCEGGAVASVVAGQPTSQSRPPICRWFAVRRDMMQQDAFLRLSPCEKVVLLDVNYRLAEHLSLVKCGLRHGPFIESDAKWANRLCMNPETFQNARVKIGLPKHKRPKTPGLGWVIYTSGYRTPDGELRRTAYHDAMYAEAVRGIQSGALYRYVWHDLIVALQKNQLRHKDLVVASFVCFFWKLLGGREMGSITLLKAKVEILTGMPAPTFRASLGRLRAVSLLNFKDKHKFGFEITKWAGGPDVRQAGVSQSASTPDFIPPIAILNSGMEMTTGKSNTADGKQLIAVQEGDRGSILESKSTRDRCPSRTRVAAKSERGRGSNE